MTPNIPGSKDGLPLECFDFYPNATCTVAFVGDVSLLALVSEVTAPASSKRLELAASSSPTPPAILAAEAAWNALRGKKEAP